MNDRVQYWLTVSIVSFAATSEEEPLGFFLMRCKQLFLKSVSTQVGRRLLETGSNY